MAELPVGMKDGDIALDFDRDLLLMEITVPKEWSLENSIKWANYMRDAIGAKDRGWPRINAIIFPKPVVDKQQAAFTLSTTVIRNTSCRKEEQGPAGWVDGPLPEEENG